MDYLKIGQAAELSGRDRALYRAFEVLPALLSWATLLGLLLLSYLKPVEVAYFIIAFDVYWLLLVAFLSIHLVAAYRRLKANLKTDWAEKCRSLERTPDQCLAGECLSVRGLDWRDVWQVVIFPVNDESRTVMEASIKAIAACPYPKERLIVALSVEERGGDRVWADAQALAAEYRGAFHRFYLTRHPDGIAGEIKGKGANQAWAAQALKRDVIDREGLDPARILASVFDSDTVVEKGYFHCLAYHFLTVPHPHRTSYQPVPVYHNNVWQAPFFSRVAANSNTFWQMMQQVRQEKLATYSSHSMPWLALLDIGFWSKTMVSEDSRIFWHCFCHYRGDYRVQPLYYPVSMDVCMDDGAWQTAKNLYKQQRRWGWGVENLPYLAFNLAKNWRVYPKGIFINRILVQLYGFHSWATNALIIGVIGWMPLLLGGDRFNETVLSTNLPEVTRTLMVMAMFGMVLSAVLSALLLPPRPRRFGPGRWPAMFLQWAILPFSIIVFGSLPGLEAQTRLALGGKWRLGFFVTPKAR